MTPGLPVAQVVAVNRERGQVRYDVLCPYCHRIHHHQSLGQDISSDLTAPCSTARSALRYRTRLDQDSTDEGRDDNAADTHYEHNWIE